ncbi:MAG: hypothetical protein LBC90_00955 [Candidatus Adiutrix sp.]|jgi:hypothetical protein|nr:hypothetical protein [Candidatus Adiutrix sp.]
MKILQFTPPPKPERPKPGRRPEAGDFDGLLKQFQASGSAGGPGGLISLENRRARQLPPVGELEEAGRLLGRLDQAIRSAPAEILSRVHGLEGLLYVYTKAGEV